MKVLQLRSSIGPFGAERVILELCKKLRKTNYQPIIGVFNNTQNPHIELAEMAQNNDIEVKIFTCHGPFDIRAILALKRFVREEGIGIIHTHGYKANFYGLMAYLITQVPIIATCHPWLETDINFKAMCYTLLDKFWLYKFDRLVAVTEELEGQIFKNGFAKKKASTIHNGIDVSRFDNLKEISRNRIRKEFNIKPFTKVIGTVGRLAPEKGHKVFIRAAKMLSEKYSNLNFVIVGDGPLLSELTKESIELGVQKLILFLGLCKDVPKILQLFDIFVLPSLTEGMPMAILEAMAAKKPIIATRVGGIPNIIEHNIDGILIHPNDSRGLSKAIEILLSDKKNAKRLAEHAYRKVCSTYSSEIMTKKYIQLYDQLQPITL